MADSLSAYLTRTCWFLRKCCASVGCHYHGWRCSWSMCEGGAVSRRSVCVSDTNKGSFSAFRGEKREVRRCFLWNIGWSRSVPCKRRTMNGCLTTYVLALATCWVRLSPEPACCVHELTIPV
ncbi:unnamed protein product [Ectocarpus sp. 6 AP-2014]